MNLIFAFFWLIFFESIPNFFGVITIVLLIFYKSRILSMKTFLYAYLGSLFSAITIVLLENIKLRVTSLPQTTAGNSIFDILLFALVFAIPMILILWYYTARKTNLKSDIAIGIVLAFLISGYEFYSAIQAGDIAVASSARFISHTLAFIVSFPVTIALIRKAGTAQSLKLALQQGVFVTLIMSALIVVFDYMPFLR